MDTPDDLDLLVRTRVALIAIETREEGRALSRLQALATRRALPMWRWSIADGLRPGGGGAQRLAPCQPAQLLAALRDSRDAGIFVLLDFHPHLADPLVRRQLRELAQGAEALQRVFVLVGPRCELPEELAEHAARYPLALPDRAEVRAIIEEEAAAWGAAQQRRLQVRGSVLDVLVGSLLGLAAADVRRLARNAIHDDGALDENDLPALQKAKYALLGGDGVLSFELDTARMADVAGLASLKAWLSQRQPVFTAPDAPVGIDPPKGVLLLGVQGAGKSLAAKACAGAFGVPLLRLDFATLYNKYYGETERNLREALATAGQMAPCVLWIDEIEKGLAEDGDGGPSRRVLGTLLTWMAERKARVFLVATANDVSVLPPELLRKGRFDEIFFVDLPTPPVRREIFAIHLRKRGLDPQNFDLDALALAAEGFSGAEIEQAVVSAQYAAHARQETSLSADVLAELARTRPLSGLMAEKVAALRLWAAERTVPAD